MNEVEFIYFVLGGATLALSILAWANWARHRGIEYLLLPAVLYYYSLYGAWVVLQTKRGAEDSDALAHLERSLFTIDIDVSYVQTILLYTIFLSVILISLHGQRLYIDQAISSRRRQGTLPSYTLLSIISALALLGSAFLLGPSALRAIAENSSFYLATRIDQSQYFTLHQLLNRIGLATLAYGWPVYLCFCRGASKSVTRLLSLLISSAIWLFYLSALGNRNELFISLIAGLYLYVFLGGRLKVRPALFLGFLAYFSLRSIQTVRALPPDALFGELFQQIAVPSFWNPLSLASGSESLAAHMSLYGLIKSDVSWTWGSSAIYFVQSLIPRAISGMRVQDSYSIYANMVGAPETQGFTIHFAAGSYLNFGVIGVLVGALLLAALLRGSRWLSFELSGRPALALPTAFAHAMTWSLLPIAMRGGPEAVKAIVVEGFVLPFLVAAAAGGGRRFRGDLDGRVSNFSDRR